MSQRDDRDQPTRTLHAVPGEAQRDEPLEFEPVQTEDHTVQSPSFLVERITPAPPRRPLAVSTTGFNEDQGATMLMDERHGPGPARDAPTAAVQNPGARPPPPRSSPGLSSPPPGEAPPDVETAYVPLPSAAPPSVATARPEPTARMARKDSTITRGLSALRKLTQGGGGSAQSSKAMRFAILAGFGVLGVLVTVMIFSPKPRPQPPPPAVTAEPAQPQQPEPPAPPAQPQDPAKIEERDALLEKAILAVEAGRTDEALALFRRYAEDDPSPVAEFMVQLLQMQLSQSDKER